MMDRPASAPAAPLIQEPPHQSGVAIKGVHARMHARVPGPHHRPGVLTRRSGSQSSRWPSCAGFVSARS